MWFGCYYLFLSIGYKGDRQETVPMSVWYVYMINCSDNSIYTGITTNVERRLYDHARGEGAKYFRGRQPKKIIYLESQPHRSAATKREAVIKQLSRREKIKLADCYASHTALLLEQMNIKNKKAAMSVRDQS